MALFVALQLFLLPPELRNLHAVLYHKLLFNWPSAGLESTVIKSTIPWCRALALSARTMPCIYLTRVYYALHILLTRIFLYCCLFYSKQDICQLFVASIELQFSFLQFCYLYLVEYILFLSLFQGFCNLTKVSSAQDTRYTTV